MCVMSTGGSSEPFFFFLFFVFWWGEFLRRGSNLPRFSIFSADLGHFILKLLKFDIYFMLIFNLVVWGAKQAT